MNNQSHTWTLGRQGNQTVVYGSIYAQSVDTHLTFGVQVSKYPMVRVGVVVMLLPILVNTEEIPQLFSLSHQYVMTTVLSLSLELKM